MTPFLMLKQQHLILLLSLVVVIVRLRRALAGSQAGLTLTTLLRLPRAVGTGKPHHHLILFSAVVSSTFNLNLYLFCMHV